MLTHMISISDMIIRPTFERSKSQEWIWGIISLRGKWLLTRVQKNQVIWYSLIAESLSQKNDNPKTTRPSHMFYRTEMS